MKTKFLAIRGVMARICESLGINRAIKISAILVCGAFFSACVDINLKSSLPKLDYYSLDNVKAQESPICEAYTLIALHKIDIPKKYANKNLLYKDGHRIHNIEGVSLSDNLDSELESMIIKSFAAHCIKVILPPFSGINAEYFLRIKLLDFIALKNSNLAQMSLAFQIYQNGAILQNGIIAEESQISPFNSENVFSALQDCAQKALKKLRDKIVAK